LVAFFLAMNCHLLSTSLPLISGSPTMGLGGLPYFRLADFFTADFFFAAFFVAFFFAI
jgi:hypothetical protein